VLFVDLSLLFGGGGGVVVCDLWSTFLGGCLWVLSSFFKKNVCGFFRTF
jgi:hypothetical protein